MKHSVLILIFLSFVLSSCSKESIQNVSLEDVTKSTAFLNSNEFLTSNFLPAFMSLYGKDRWTSTNRSSSLASEWVHEYDNNGKLIKSSFFELFPYRILKEVTYHNIVEDYKLKYEIKAYSYYGLLHSDTQTYELKFDDNLNIQTISPDVVIKELNSEGWVTKTNTVAPNGYIVYQTGYEYDKQGRNLKYISYNSNGTLASTVDYSYNENGDPSSYHFQNTKGDKTRVNYYYREDNTLKRLEEEYYHADGEFGTKIFTYSLEEKFSKQIVNNGNGSKKIVSYFEDRIVEEHFTNDILNEIYKYQIQDGKYCLKSHEEYLNGIIHKIKYYDTNGELEYAEYYDSNGNLTETVYE